jgi:polar amino acid transport system substrate-binding protein
MQRELYLLFYLVLVWPIHSNAQPLTFVAEDLPPYHYVDKNGNAAGALVDVTKAILHEAQLSGQFEIMPMARAYYKLKNNPTSLMMSLLLTPERKPHFTWLGQLYFTDAYLVSLKNSSHQINKLADAKKLKVGTIRGYSSARYLQTKGFQEDKNLILVSHYKQLWDLLFKERVDLIMTNTMTLAKELKNSGYSVNQVAKILPIKRFPSQLQLAANQDISKNTCRHLIEALEKIKQSGLYEQILTRWQLTIPKHHRISQIDNIQHPQQLEQL